MISLKLKTTKDQEREHLRLRAREAAKKYLTNRKQRFKHTRHNKKQNPFDRFAYPEEHTQWNAYFHQYLRTH